MEINKLLFAGLLVGCVGAAGTGGYLALRQNGNQPALTASTAVPGTEPNAAVVAGQPVTASEGVITPGSTLAPPAVVPPTVTPAPARRTESPRSTRTTPSRPTTPPVSQTMPPAPTPAPTSDSMWQNRPAVEPAALEPAEPPPPPAPEYVDLVVPSESVLGLLVQNAVSSELARVEDRVEARVTRDLRVDGRVAIPAGATVQGSVTDVERGGKVREQARLGVRFHTVVLADGTRLNLRTDTITRLGQSPSGESSAKIGGAAAGGAILGAILGGGKGAAIGGAIGAAGGTAATMAGGRNPALLPAGTTLSVRIQQPVTVTVEKE